ncbi:hypothetical protein [Streptomyces meridianus]|uniref:Uncharacterized protein n=1 Tax=Streptomyces meridianus TaxID=2938945 RepID=A0ABT0X024_9ACTN|nr:hypothetical protein [Streptomyces meridianus]MCM2575917.1 hypothetical protein [Streptomyces meridianus]
MRTERQTLVDTTALFSDPEPAPFRRIVKGSPPPTGGLFQAPPDFEEADRDDPSTAADLVAP